MQQTPSDPTIDEFYYDGSAKYRIISLSGVHGKAQITFLLYIACDSGFCGNRCAEPCQNNNVTCLFTTRTMTGIDVLQQNSEQMSKLSTESTITIATGTVLIVLVLIGLVMLLVLIVITARKWKGLSFSLSLSLSLPLLPPSPSPHKRL